jgi:hypothetical protein
MNWKCHTCGIEHDDLPTCFGALAPCHEMVPADEFASRVILSEDQCVVDEEYFFIRGHLNVPILGHDKPFAFSVWVAISDESFAQIGQRWEHPQRAGDRPYRGELYSELSPYESTRGLKVAVRSQPPGIVPFVVLEPCGHELAVDQQCGITVERWQEMVHQLLHQHGGKL